MAAPGFRWVLVKDGDAPSTSQQQQQQQQIQPPDADRGHLDDMPASPASTTTSAVDTTVFDLLRAGSEASSSHQLVPQGSHPHSTGGGADGAYGAARRASRAEAQMERLRAAVRAKTGEVAGLESRVRELQAACDSLAEELLRATQRIEAVSAGKTCMTTPLQIS